MKIYELFTGRKLADYTTLGAAKAAAIKHKYPIDTIAPVPGWDSSVQDGKPTWTWDDYVIEEVDVVGPHEVYVVLENVSDFDPSEVPVAITPSLTAAKNYIVDQGVEADDIKKVTEQDSTTWDTCCHTEAEMYLGADTHSGEYRIITMAVLDA